MTMSDRTADQLSDAFVLHTRKYRDTSLIVELLTADEGRIAAVMRGVRTKRSRASGYVRPFSRLLVSWFGRGDLKTIKTADFPFQNPVLEGDALFMGFYVNELLVKLLEKHDPVQEIFLAYGQLLEELAKGSSNTALRRFELTLLGALGYGVPFSWDAGDGSPVEIEATYRFVPETGFFRVAEQMPGDHLYSGADLMSITNEDFEHPGVDAQAKRIIRASLAVLLGGKPVKSRELFRPAQGTS